MFRSLVTVIAFVTLTGAASAQYVGRHQDFHPSMSPDGERVVYYSYREPNFPDLFIVNRETLEEEQLTETPGLWEIEPDWSPTRNLIAFSRGRSMRALDLVILDVDTGEERNLGPGYNAAWSRDGEQIAWDRDGRIWIANWDGSDARALPLDEIGEGSKGDPSWSFDGTVIIFLYERPDSEHSSRFEIYGYFFDEDIAAQLSVNGFQETHPALLPNDEEIIFGASLISPNPRIYRMNADRTGDIRQVSPDNGTLMHYFPSIGSDQETLLFEAGTWSDHFYIYEQPLDGEGEARQLSGLRND